jgi:hypothetical protein
MEENKMNLQQKTIVITGASKGGGNVMKALKIGMIVVACVVLVGCIAARWYRDTYSQKVAEVFEVNSPELETKVLIATQGSEFKEALVANLLDRLGKKPVYIKGIDALALPEIHEAGWHAVVLINACQSSKLQPDVKDYLTRAKRLDKVVLVTTSGFGTGKTEYFPVDAISTASQKAKVQPLAAEIMKRLDVILEQDS